MAIVYIANTTELGRLVEPADKANDKPAEQRHPKHRGDVAGRISAGVLVDRPWDTEREANANANLIDRLHSGFSGAGLALATFFNRSSQCASSSSASRSRAACLNFSD